MKSKGKSNALISGLALYIMLVFAALTGIQSRVQADIITFDDLSTFLVATGASATAPIPNLGVIPPGDATASQTVGDLTFTITPPSTNFVMGPFTTRIAGNEIAISDLENLNVDLASPVFSLGFEFVEPEFDPELNGPFVDSTFEVTMFNSAVFVDSFTFNAPNDTFAFVGVWGDSLFDHVEIREIVGGIGNEFFGQFYTGTTTAVPEPTTIALLGIGLAGLGGGYLRRRRRTTDK